MKTFNEDDFKKTYRGIDSFITKGRIYYDAFLKLLLEKDTLEKIKFANDVLCVPPIKTFIILRNDIFNKPMEKFEKQGLGACFGYLYKFMYDEGYEAEQVWVNDPLTGIKTASYFKK